MTVERMLFSPDDAARYLGISRSHFDETVRPFLPVVEMKPPGGKQSLPRFARPDLDAFWAARRLDKRAVAAASAAEPDTKAKRGRAHA